MKSKRHKCDYCKNYFLTLARLVAHKTKCAQRPLEMDLRKFIYQTLKDHKLKIVDMREYEDSHVPVIPKYRIVKNLIFARKLEDHINKVKKRPKTR